MAEDYRLQVTATKATWVGDKAYYELVARISTRKKGIPFPEGEFIVFDPGGHRKQIDSRGDAFIRLSTTSHGVFTTIARLESDPDIRDTVEVVVPEKTKEKATFRKLSKPCVRAEGDNGDYIISVSVAYDDGGVASGIPVRLLVSKLGKPAEIKDLKTNENGFDEYHLKFEETECDVTWQSPPFEDEIRNLAGPLPKSIAKVVIPEPTDDELSGSLWDVIKTAWAKDIAGEKPKKEKRK